MPELDIQACRNLAADLTLAALDDLTGTDSDEAAEWLLSSPIAGMILGRLGLCDEDIPDLVARFKHTDQAGKIEKQALKWGDFG